MKNSFELFEHLLHLKNEDQIIHYLIDFFSSNLPSQEKNEALKLFLDSPPKKLISSKQLIEFMPELTNLPRWMIDRSNEETGNLVKALSLLLHAKGSCEIFSLSDWIFRISNIKTGEHNMIMNLLDELSKHDPSERLLMLKLLTGTYRLQIPKILINKALAQVFETSVASISLRIFNRQENYKDLNNPIPFEQSKSPLPFPKIQELESNILESLGEAEEWNAYGYLDGIKAQIVMHEESVHLWSEESEILNNRFPEIVKAVVPMKHLRLTGQIVPQNSTVTTERLRGRIMKKSISKKEIEAYPAIFQIWNDQNQITDVEEITRQSGLNILNVIHFASWEQLKIIHTSCRQSGYEGILLRQKKEPSNFLYLKAPNFSINAILIYAELGGINNHGIKSLTFGIFKDDMELIPIAKVAEFKEYIDLTEILEFIKHNTTEKFGPVRTVKPELAFELHFDNISESKRRKSGLLLSNVQINKKQILQDASISKLSDIRKLLQ